MSRLEANREILKKLSELVEQNPELRFFQLLGITHPDAGYFYEESQDTLSKLTGSVKFNLQNLNELADIAAKRLSEDDAFIDIINDIKAWYLKPVAEDDKKKAP